MSTETVFTEAQVRDRIRKVVILVEIMQQFGHAKTDIEIHDVPQCDIDYFYHDLNDKRYHMSLEEQQTCELPEGLHRPRRGSKEHH